MNFIIKDFIEKNEPDIRKNEYMMKLKNEYITRKQNPKTKVQLLEV